MLFRSGCLRIQSLIPKNLRLLYHYTCDLSFRTSICPCVYCRGTAQMRILRRTLILAKKPRTGIVSAHNLPVPMPGEASACLGQPVHRAVWGSQCQLSQCLRKNLRTNHDAVKNHERFKNPYPWMWLTKFFKDCSRLPDQLQAIAS